MAKNIEALVIGNGAYSANLKLECPKKDAESVANGFRDLRFNVTLGTNLSYDQTAALVDDFIERVNRPSTNVSILYYSGHGMQINGENYIIPIDFDHYAEQEVTKLFSVQSILDRMTSASAIRIVMLDACRNNAPARQFVGGKGIASDKAFFINNKPLGPSGLAEMRAENDTFIAFAAAPGDVALDGIAGSTLSPFTQALLKQLDVVDLPLANLTSRVRQDVLRRTGGRQRTWDQSSLMLPFYFKPASPLFFTGIYLALLGFAYSILVSTLAAAAAAKVTPGEIAALAVFPALSLLVVALEAQSVYARLRGNIGWEMDGEASVRGHLLACLRRGLVGGYLGALVAAGPLSGMYYRMWENLAAIGAEHEPTVSFAQLLLEVTVATAFAAGMLGFLCTYLPGLSVASRRLVLASRITPFRIWFGALFGGAVAGIMIAPFVTLYFGRMTDRPEMFPQDLLPGAVIGASFIVFSIINFDFERLTSRRVWAGACSSVLAVVAGALAAMAVFGPLYLLGAVDGLVSWLEHHWHNNFDMLVGGALYGIPVGIVLGFVIGIAIIFTEAWSRKPVLA